MLDPFALDNHFAIALTFDKTSGNQLSQVAVTLGTHCQQSHARQRTVIQVAGQPDIGTADRLDPATHGGLVKLHQRTQVALIGHRHGRLAQVLILMPRDGLRYSYRFWIDSEYGLLLKSVMFNNRDEIMESIGFNQVALMNNVALDWFKPKIDHNKNYVMEREHEVVADTGVPVDWEIRALPAGYRKVDQLIRKVPGKSGPVTHVIFSDGLASVSLFIEHIAQQNREKPMPKSVLTTAGNTSFYASVNNGHLVTVVGDVPEATVVQIANAVVFKK